MKYIVVVYPDGVVGKFDEGDVPYETYLSKIRTSNPNFLPYDDDPELPQNWVEVMGMNGKAKIFIQSTPPLPHQNMDTSNGNLN